MAVMELWRRRDLEGAVKTEYVDGNFFTQDSVGNLVGVKCYKDGAEATLSGSVTGYCILPSGETVSVAGTRSGNQAYILIPQSALAYAGPLGVVLKLIDGNTITTLISIIVVVYRSKTDTVITPSSQIITDWSNQIAAALQDVEDASAAQDAKIDDLKGAFEGNLEGLAGIKGKYVNSSGVETDSSALKCSNFIKIPEDAIGIKIYTKYTTTNNTLGNFGPYALIYDESKTIVKTIQSNTADIVIDDDGYATYMFKALSVPGFIRFNQSQKDADAENVLFEFIRFSLDDIVGAYQFLTVADTPNLNGMDFHSLGKNKIYYRSSTSTTVANMPYNNWLGVAFTINPTSITSGTFVVAISNTNRIHICRSYGADPGTWSDWVEVASTANAESWIKENIGLIGTYTGAFTQQEQVNTGIRLQPNTTYFIKFLTERANNWNIYGSGNTANYKRVRPWVFGRYFTNDATIRDLILYNVNESLDDIDIEVYKAGTTAERAVNTPKIYRVGHNEYEFDYTSLTQCLIDLKEDHDPKIIEIAGGDYDIYQEYQDAGVPVYTGTSPSMEYWDYCVWIPENTHIIGKGRVRLMWMPDRTSHPEITWMQCYAVSPVNAAATMTLENVEIHCKNGRYCIHNDPLGKIEFINAVQRYINVKCYKYAGDIDETTTPGERHIFGTQQLLGFGMDRQQHIYEGCTFVNVGGYRAFYGHSRGSVGGVAITEETSGEIICKDCIFETSSDECIKFGNNTSTGIHIPVRFSNCHFSSQINSIAENGVENRNAYDMTFLNCGEVDVHISDANNRYDPKGYGTTVNLV